MMLNIYSSAYLPPFGERSSIFWPCFNWDVYFLTFELWKFFLCILDIKFLIRYLICEYLLSLHGLPFHSVDNILWCIKFFTFVEVELICFFFCCLFFWCYIQEFFFFSLLNQEVIAESSVMKRYPCVFF